MVEEGERTRKRETNGANPIAIYKGLGSRSDFA